MATFLASATQAAHSAVATLLSVAQIKPGSKISTGVPVKEDNPKQAITLDNLTGKNIIVGIPGAFTPTCSNQVPGYISTYRGFKEKGVQDIYVVAVNDAFVMKAWKAKLAPDGTPVRFIADDKGTFVGSLGLLFDASDVLGGPRAKRFAIITDGMKVTEVLVEPDPDELTVTAASHVLPLLSL